MIGTRYPLELAYELGTEAARGFTGDHVLRMVSDPLAVRRGREPTADEREQYEQGQRDESERLSHAGR
jgi:hypothetical protein